MNMEMNIEKSNCKKLDRDFIDKITGTTQYILFDTIDECFVDKAKILYNLNSEIKYRSTMAHEDIPFTIVFLRVKNRYAKDFEEKFVPYVDKLIEDSYGQDYIDFKKETNTKFLYCKENGNG